MVSNDDSNSALQITPAFSSLLIYNPNLDISEHKFSSNLSERNEIMETSNWTYRVNQENQEEKLFPTKLRIRKTEELYDIGFNNSLQDEYPLSTCKAIRAKPRIEETIENRGTYMKLSHEELPMEMLKITGDNNSHFSNFCIPGIKPKQHWADRAKKDYLEELSNESEFCEEPIDLSKRVSSCASSFSPSSWEVEHEAEDNQTFQMENRDQIKYYDSLPSHTSRTLYRSGDVPIETPKIYSQFDSIDEYYSPELFKMLTAGSRCSVSPCIQKRRSPPENQPVSNQYVQARPTPNTAARKRFVVSPFHMQKFPPRNHPVSNEFAEAAPKIPAGNRFVVIPNHMQKFPYRNHPLPNEFLESAPRITTGNRFIVRHIHLQKSPHRNHRVSNEYVEAAHKISAGNGFVVSPFYKRKSPPRNHLVSDELVEAAPKIDAGNEFAVSPSYRQKSPPRYPVSNELVEANPNITGGNGFAVSPLYKRKSLPRNHPVSNRLVEVTPKITGEDGFAVSPFYKPKSPPRNHPVSNELVEATPKITGGDGFAVSPFYKPKSPPRNHPVSNELVEATPKITGGDGFAVSPFCKRKSQPKNHQVPNIFGEAKPKIKRESREKQEYYAKLTQEELRLRKQELSKGRSKKHRIMKRKLQETVQKQLDQEKDVNNEKKIIYNELEAKKQKYLDLICFLTTVIP